MRHTFLILACSVLPVVLPGQQQPVAIAAGSPLVQPSRIPHTIDRFEMVAVRDGSPEVSMGTYATKVELIDRILLITQETTFQQGTMIDSAWVDPVTFVPIRQVSNGPAGTSELRYEAGRVRGSRTLPGGVVTTTDESPVAATFSASLAPMMVRALPLAAGFTATFPVFRDPGGVGEATVRVIGREQVPGSTRTAWRVSMSLGPSTATLWIDEGKEFRTEAPMPTGATFVMRPADAAKPD